MYAVQRNNHHAGHKDYYLLAFSLLPRLVKIKSNAEEKKGIITEGGTYADVVT